MKTLVIFLMSILLITKTNAQENKHQLFKKIFLPLAKNKKIIWNDTEKNTYPIYLEKPGDHVRIILDDSSEVQYDFWTGSFIFQIGKIMYSISDHDNGILRIMPMGNPIEKQILIDSVLVDVIEYTEFKKYEEGTEEYINASKIVKNHKFFKKYKKLIFYNEYL